MEEKSSSEHHDAVESTSTQTERSCHILGEPGIWEATHDDAQAARAHEHSLSILTALSSYKLAVFWSLLISMSIIMEGYDTILIGSLYAYPSYARRFGDLDPSTGQYQIPPKWQSAMGSGPQVGAIIGALVNGWLIQRFGFRPAFMLGVMLMTGFCFISFFGTSVELQAIGQIFCGIPWGIFATIGPAYASELCPLPLRAYLTAYVNMCFAAGQLIGAGVLQSFIDRTDDWAWRIPFAFQWIWIPILFTASIFMPESPWYLVRQGRYAEAEKTASSLMSKHEKLHAKQLVALMIQTDNLERNISEGTQYWDCFKGIDLRRTEIACVTFIGQVTCGISFAFSATYFFQQAGLSSDDSYKLNLGGTGIALCGTLISWFLMKGCGRRCLFLTGMGFMSVWLLIIGGLAVDESNSSVKWVQSALCLVWLFTFSLTVGPVGWIVPAEVSSTRLRSKTVVLARTCYYIAQIIASLMQPYMMNPTSWNWRGKTGFFWFGFATITALWAFYRLPETQGRSYEELDVMFNTKVPTRRFKNYHVDVYEYDDEKGLKEV